MPTDLPDGFQVQVDLARAPAGDRRYLVGGSPTRMLRLSDAPRNDDALPMVVLLCVTRQPEPSAVACSMPGSPTRGRCSGRLPIR